MKINKKILIESTIVSILIILLPIVINVIQGLLRTKKYAPDIIDEYATADVLQHKVSFGIFYGFGYNWVTIIVGIGAVFFLILIYYGIRIRIDQWIKKMR